MTRQTLVGVGTLKTGLLLISLLSIASVALLVYRGSSNQFSPNGGPRVGSQLHDSLRSRLPAGGKVLVVSETCEACVLRASSYVRDIEKNSDHLLMVVASGNGGVFQRTIGSNKAAARRTIFLTPAEADNYARVKMVPSYISIDNAGVVVSTGVSFEGLLNVALNPRSWLQGWKSLLKTNSVQ